MRRLKDSVKNRSGYWKGKHLSDEAKKKISLARVGTQGKNAKEVMVINKNLDIIDVVRSRTLTFERYTTIPQGRIRNCVETNSKINDIKEIVFANSEITFIYSQDYNLLKPQSTIETIPCGVA